MKFVNSSAEHRFAGYPFISLSRWKKSFRTYPGLLFLRTMIPLVLILSLPTQSTLAQDDPESPNTPSTAWNIQFVDASPYIDRMTNRSLAFRPADGAPCIAFGGDHLYYSCQASGIWTTTTVDGSTRVGEYAALAFNTDGLPFISYYDVTNKKLKLAYHNGIAWQLMFVPDHPLVPTMPEEDIEQIEESSDQPVQKTFEEEFRSLLRPWLEPLLEPEPDVQVPNFDYDESPGVGKHTSIEVDYLNRIHITFLDDLDSSFWYVRWTGGSDWNFKLVDYYPDRKRVGLWSSIAVDDSLGVHISYMSEKYDSLKYAYRKPNGNWKQCTIDGKAPGGYYNYNFTGSFSSIALDKDDDPHISYYDFGHGVLKHAWLAYDECYEGVHRANYNRGWKIETVDDGDSVGWYSSIAISSSGNTYISYFDAGDRELKVAYKSGSWASKTIHDDWGNNGHLTSIAFASDGKPAISYFNAEYGLLQYTKCYGSCTTISKSKWDGPSTVYNAYFRDVGLSTSLAVKSTGIPFISYLDTSSGYLKHARAIGSAWWKAPLLTSPHAGLYSSIQLYGDTDPRVAFYDTDDHDLVWASLGGTGWSFSDIDTTYDVGQYISMALDSTGVPQMSYYDATNHDLIYAYWDIGASDWITQSLDTIGDVGMYTSIVLDSANKPYISYYDASHDSLKYAFKSDINAWVFVTVDDDPTDVIDVGLYTSIIVKGTYQPYITYYDKTNGDLKYAYSTDPNGVIWNIAYVDNSVNDVGMFGSLKRYPAADSLHVCYYDATDMDLMYAKGTGASAIAWVIEKVDQDGDVGLFCSMGLTGAGLPVISYYDNSGGDLKIALDSGIVLPPAAGQLLLPLVRRAE